MFSSGRAQRLRVGVKRWVIRGNKRRGFAQWMAGEERWKDEEHFLALDPSPQGQHSVNRESRGSHVGERLRPASSPGPRPAPPLRHRPGKLWTHPSLLQTKRTDTGIDKNA